MPEGIPFISYLFWPWGFIVQFFALAHAIKHRASFWWFWIILMFGFVGGAAYIFVEVVPDLHLMAHRFAGPGRRRRIKELETKIVDNPSPANYEELGELYFEEKQYGQAREAYDKSITARSDSLHTFYHRGLCSLALGDHAGALPDLETVVHKDPKFAYDRAATLLADTYGKTGHAEAADAWFQEITRTASMPETLCRYALFLKAQGRNEARAWAQKTLDKKRTLPRYTQRREREWFLKAKALIKEIDTPNKRR
jgi:hypothetical protein